MDPLQFATHLARETGVILSRYYRPTGIQVNIKADHTVVTEADIAADRYLQDAIKKAYPSDGVLSEEAGTIYPEQDAPVWIIDPLDGTTNFSLGMHYWGVSIARMVDGEPDTAAIYFPFIDELYTAQRGQGAYLNGGGLRITPPDFSKPNTFFACCSRAQKRYQINIPYKTRILGSAAYDICSVARGSSILAFNTTPKIWDLAAGWLVVEEAGGIIHNMGDESIFPMQANMDYDDRDYPLLIAATAELAASGIENIQLKSSKTLASIPQD